MEPKKEIKLKLIVKGENLDDMSHLSDEEIVQEFITYYNIKNKTFYVEI